MRKRAVILCAGLLVLSALWFWRYKTLNQYYSQLDSSSVRYFDMGEAVPFENDYIEWEESAAGYFIQVDQFKIQEYDQYLEEASIQIDPMLNSEKIALVYITLRNEDNSDSVIFLSDFCLHGMDSIQGMDWQLLTAVNPILNNGHGIQLRPGSQEQFVLPFYIKKDSFGSDTWAHLEGYTFYLRVTAFPTQKDIRLEVTTDAA